LSLSMTLDLKELGWDDGWSAAFEPYRKDGLEPARVAVQHRGGYVVLAERGELRAEAARKLVREGALATVGDWVALRFLPGDERALVEAVLPRRTKFSRKAAHGPSELTEEQVVAANIDTVFVVSALGRDLNVRRLERYLATAWESGAQPVIVLTKSDLHPELVAAAREEVGAIAFAVPVHAISNVTGEGVDELQAYLAPGHTVALLGSSGVGKSTLANRLVGHELLATREVRADEKGRHTTSHRELVVLPGGALLIDTPGMRELQLWDVSEGFDEAFADVVALAQRCRFGDCAHESEPGCAVRAALADGRLPADRWESYRKLQRELEALRAKTDKAFAADRRRQWRKVNKARRRNSS
jgi:ribosome biogenesis GTPase / thiamine phosphate phosphatase